MRGFNIQNNGLMHPSGQGGKGRPVREAASLVEILMAVSLMAITAVGVFQVLAFTETQLIQSRNVLEARKGEEQLLSYVYDDFLESNLADTLTPALYDNDAVALEDLRVVTVFGQQSRYQAGFTMPKCRTIALTSETVGTVSSPADCVVTPEGGGTTRTLAQNINAVIAAGATVVFGVENGGGRCTDNASIRLVDKVNLDLSKYREFCNTN